MDSGRVDMFIMMHSKELPEEKLPMLRGVLLNIPDVRWEAVMTVSFTDPTVTLILSLLLGNLGVDRFMIGDVWAGVLKLLTGGGCGVWYIVDWFLIMGATRNKNFERLMSVVNEERWNRF